MIMSKSMKINTPRDLPPVDEVMRDEKLADALQRHGHAMVLRAVRNALDEARETLLMKSDAVTTSTLSYSVDDLIRKALDKLELWSTPLIQHVINATGAILHSNLGRAPLASVAAEAAYNAGRRYTTLEYNLEEGARGERTAAVEILLQRLASVESALVVNNNAAAVLLILATLARGREVVVSRGELVEIGGSFRIPEIMEESGAMLREIGTTNKTHPDDYLRAIGDETAAILKVNRSNFRIEGFTEDVALDKLATIAHQHGLPLIYDLGSGCLSRELHGLIREEPLVLDATATGADVICFSGDKLLGGPQSGIIVGRRRYIEAMRRHPLLRAFRCDKMTLAALEATLLLYLNPSRAHKEIPLLAMALANKDVLEKRVSSFVNALNEADVPASMYSESSIVGCGSAPGCKLATPVVAIDPSCAPRRSTPDELLRQLREEKPFVIARAGNGRVMLDLRTVFPEEEDTLLQRLLHILA